MTPAPEAVEALARVLGIASPVRANPGESGARQKQIRQLAETTVDILHRAGWTLVRAKDVGCGDTLQSPDAGPVAHEAGTTTTGDDDGKA